MHWAKETLLSIVVNFSVSQLSPLHSWVLCEACGSRKQENMETSFMDIRTNLTFLQTDLSTLWERGMWARKLGSNFSFLEKSRIWYCLLRNGHSNSLNYCWKPFYWNDLVIRYRISLQTTSPELAPMRKNSELSMVSACQDELGQGLDQSLCRAARPCESNVISINSSYPPPSLNLPLPSAAPKPRNGWDKDCIISFVPCVVLSFRDIFKAKRTNVNSYHWYVSPKNLLLPSQCAGTVRLDV